MEISKYMSQAQLVAAIQMGQGASSFQSNAMAMPELPGAKAAMGLGMEFEKSGRNRKAAAARQSE